MCVPCDVVSAELLQPLELLVHGLGAAEDGLEAGQQPGHGGGAGEAVMLCCGHIVTSYQRQSGS